VYAQLYLKHRTHTTHKSISQKCRIAILWNAASTKYRFNVKKTLQKPTVAELSIRHLQVIAIQKH